MYKYEFTEAALKSLQKLPREIQIRLTKKLDYFISFDNPLIFADHLINHEIGNYRFRVGDYRVVFDIEDEILVILALGHRRDIYK